MACKRNYIRSMAINILRFTKICKEISKKVSRDPYSTQNAPPLESLQSSKVKRKCIIFRSIGSEACASKQKKERKKEKRNGETLETRIIKRNSIEERGEAIHRDRGKKIIIKWCDYRERRRSKTARSRSIILRFVSGKRNWLLLLNIASTIDRRGYLVHVIERKPRE